MATYPLFLCSNTETDSSGLYRSVFDTDSQTLSEPQKLFQLNKAGFLAIDQERKRLFATSLSDDGSKSAVTSFQIDPDTYDLSMINRQELDNRGWMYLSINSLGTVLFAVDFFEGDVVTYPVSSDGIIGEVATRHVNPGSSIHVRNQTQTHPHSIGPDPLNRIAIVPDRGSDDVYLYRFDSSTGELSRHDIASLKFRPGSGPRHFAWHSNNKWLYIINEIGNTITLLHIDESAEKPEIIQYVNTLPEAFSSHSTTSEVAISSDGKFLYGANRGDDSIVAFSIDQSDGRLSLVGHSPTGGKISRYFDIDPTGNTMVVANTGSDTITLHSRNQESGMLTPLDQIIEIGRCPCLKFLRS